MELVLPYNATPFELNVNYSKQVVLSFSSTPQLVQELFQQLFSHMSYEDLIDSIGEDEFQSIIKFYHEEYTQ